MLQQREGLDPETHHPIKDESMPTLSQKMIMGGRGITALLHLLSYLALLRNR